MNRSEYLVIGSSHAGLAAIDAIRTVDQEGSVTLLSREDRAPYSPTILPHVMTGRIAPESARIRDLADLESLKVTYLPGAEVADVETETQRVVLASGEKLEYGKLLLATGAVPTVPSIPGLDQVPFHVLRTLDDAVRLRARMLTARKAVVLGAGLIGLHGAECLTEGGCQVTVVEALPQIAPGYFDRDAAHRLEEIFIASGVRIVCGCRASMVEKKGHEGILVSLDPGGQLEADLLLVATGVQCNTGYLAGNEIHVGRGIQVDSSMRTSAPKVWAAGDVAQAQALLSEGSAVIPTVTNAMEQGRIAGFDMADDRGYRPYPGTMAANTSGFFGHRAFSVGLGASEIEEDDLEVDRCELGSEQGFLKLVFRDNRLVGATGIDADVDPGILAELIRRKVDLSGVRSDMAKEPRRTGRVLMSSLWG